MANNSLEKARKEINEIDKEMAELFVRRMNAVMTVAKYKQENNLQILDKSREAEVVKRGTSYIEDEELKNLYVPFIQKTMELSRSYQSKLIRPANKSDNIIRVNLGEGYDIHIGRGLLDRAGEIFNLGRRVLIVTDSGVPKEYAERVKALCTDAKIVTVEQGESSKSFSVLESVCRQMLDFGMTRSDCVVAVGGGVVGDLAGFAAASYMRGVDFYNIPTTLLSQVDSSIGGKTAINLGGVKNIAGAFYQPKGVIVDPDVLKTLPRRQFINGLSEAIKMSLTSDEALFKLIESENIEENIEKIIYSSLLIKKSVVEADERESGIRRILNFGHTLGHALEAEEEMNGLYHGECVAIGMTAVCSEKVKTRLVYLLKKVGLPYRYDGNIEGALSFISHDKKCEGDSVSIVFVDKIGSYRIEKMGVADFCNHVREVLK